MADNQITSQRTGLMGIVAGLSILVACELPIILAVIGLGGLGTQLAAFSLPVALEIAALAVMVIGIGLLAAARIRGHQQNAKR